MTDDLKNKRVIITAAATGIGRVTAESFLAAGARVYVCDVDEAGLKAFKAAHPALGAAPADVADPAQLDRFFDAALAGLGGLDIMVNNAGIAGPTANVEDVKLEDWRRTLAVNLDATYMCCRRVVPVLKKNGSGAIINLSSAAGIHGFARRTPYASAKWAIVGLTKSLALELGPFGIRVNAICPGRRRGRPHRARDQGRGQGERPFGGGGAQELGALHRHEDLRQPAGHRQHDPVPLFERRRARIRASVARRRLSLHVGRLTCAGRYGC